MQERRSATHAGTTGHGAKHEDGPGPGKTTRTGQLAVQAKAVKGGDDNVDIDHLNKDHAGSDTARLGQRGKQRALEKKARGAHGKAKEKIEDQLDRLEHDHFGYRTLKASPYYDPEGRELGTVPAHWAVLLNAGTITKIKLNPGTRSQDIVAGPSSTRETGHPIVECAFVFEMIDPHDPAGKRQSAGGWIPTLVLPTEARKAQRELAKDISKARDDKHDKFDAQPVPILTREQVPDLSGKFTYPVPKQMGRTGPENQAKDYLYNLSLNVPLSGGKRFGVETTRLDRDLDAGAPDLGPHPTHPLDAYHAFYPETPRKEVQIDLYAPGAKQPSGEKMAFVYGYVQTSAGAKIHGWINKFMLGTPAPPPVA